jgi:hypothetical protein
MDAYEKEKRKGAKGKPIKKPEKPIQRHPLVSDTTIEKLGEVLADCPRGTFLARDELGAWLSSFQRYKGKAGGSDLHHWLEAFHGRPWKIDRKTGARTTLYVPRAAVSITGGLTPGILASVVSQEFLDAGLAARLLMAMPPRVPKRWTEIAVDLGTEDVYDWLLGTLLALEPDEDSQGELAPVKLYLTPEGQAAWVQFYNRWAQEQAAAEGDLAASFSKLEGYGARLALIHHVVRQVMLPGNPLGEEVGPESVRAGAALARWFGMEARRIYGLLSESQEERETRRLTGFICDRGNQITVKELQRSNSRRWRTATEAENALNGLVELGVGKWAEKSPGPQGGRPTRVFTLIAPDETDETSFLGEEEGDEEGISSEGTPTDLAPKQAKVSAFETGIHEKNSKSFGISGV